MVLKSIWLISHIFTLGYLTRYRYIISLALILLFSYFYFNIGFVGDIYKGYIYEIQNIEDSRFEYGFKFLVTVLFYIGFDNRETMYILQFLMFLSSLFLVYKITNYKNYIFTMTFLLLSTFFFLGIENAFRQGLAIIFLLLFFISIVEQKYYLSIFYLIIAEGLHYSSMVFAVIMVVNFIILNKLYDKKIQYFILSKYKFYMILCLSTILFFTIGKIVEPYLMAFAVRNNERMGGLLKPLLVMVIFVISNHFWIRKVFITRLDIFLLYQRSIFFGLFFAFSLISGGIEIASRILLFYFALEIILAMKMFFYSTRHKIGVLIVLLSYGMAINIYTLLEQTIEG